MSMLVDDRAGSRDLKPHLDKLRIPNTLGRLEFGDVAFLGRGPNEDWKRIGVEYKSLADVLSCITTGRFAGHQLVGMVRDYDVSWLLIQGVWRTDPASGVVQVHRHGAWTPLTLGGRRYMGRDLDGFLLTITQQSGMRIHRTGSEQEAAAWLGALYKWWTEKTWDQHSSLQTFDLSGPVIEITAPNVVRRIAKELPHVGWKKSLAVAQAFPTVQIMVGAEEEDWARIPGIGKKIAKDIIQALTEVPE